MRKMGIGLLVGVCLLAAAPVLATDGAEGGSWLGCGGGVGRRDRQRSEGSGTEGSPSNELSWKGSWQHGVPSWLLPDSGYRQRVAQPQWA
jgi:hypothetical protein